MAVQKWFAPVVALVVILHLSLATVDSESSDKDQFLWQILSAKNYSSQIRVYPHVLLLVTVPWCGESRSLMREISQKLVMEQQKYKSLKLMLIHRNLDEVLANSLDATEGITILFYRHAVSYKYKGSLRVHEILSSIHHLVSLAPEDLPFERLTNAKDLQMFITSTDKAVLLFESCGWTSKLLAKQSSNVTRQGDVVSGGLNKEINRTSASGRQKKLNVDTNNETMDCDIGNGCGTSPWVGEFSAENGTTTLENEDVQSTFGSPCSFDAYKKYESFFSKFMGMERTLFLPQRQRFGIVSERSLLPPLAADVSDQWSLIISYAGCPDCLRIVKEENHLGALEIVDLPVMELEDKRNDVGPALPIDKPSILLFVDRMSDFSDSRRKSHEALHAFREVAKKHWKPYQVGQNVDWPKQSSVNNYRVSASAFGNHRLLLSPSSQKIKLKDKMSIMIINEGKEVALDNEALNLQSGSLHEILTYLMGQKKNSKLSSVAKEAGFHLLSDDLDIKATDALSSQTERQNQDSDKKSVSVFDDGSIDMSKDQRDEGSTLARQEEQSEPVNIKAIPGYNELDASSYVASEVSAFVDPHQSSNAHEVASVVDVDSKVQTDVLINETEGLQHHFGGFTGSFFFSDGSYELLRSLTGGSEVPRIVIVDPITQQHYVFHEMTNFCISSLSSFIEGFINGTLAPYQRSGLLRNAVEMQHPPFVNLDFHEKDSIPCVTTETFSELVYGSGLSNASNATNTWHKDTLVLFSTSWCGFCQRMELVVREVYRAVEGYWKVVKYEAASKEGLSEDKLQNTIMEPPAIYTIDCTMNECGLILKTAGQSEVYPTLLLFPATRKTAIPYDGNMMVADIIKFIANHGSNSHHLATQKGIIWTDWEERNADDYKFRDAMESVSIVGSAGGNNKHFEAFLNDGKLQNPVLIEPNEKANRVSIDVGSFLVATKNMHRLSPFNEARILLVSADPRLGFLGLIVNKPISWDSLTGFEGFEMLKKALLSFGGPVIHKEMPLVSLTRNALNDENPHILPGVFYLDQLATFNVIELVRAGNLSATDYWFFWGYSGWGWDQLFSEIAAGVWSFHEGKTEDLLWT